MEKTPLMRCKRRPFCGVIYTIKERCLLPGVVPQCVNLNCVTNRVAQGPRYKLSYDAKTIQEHTHSS
jgi:hypothetical protein